MAPQSSELPRQPVAPSYPAYPAYPAYATYPVPGYQRLCVETRRPVHPNDQSLILATAVVCPSSIG